MAPRKFKPVPEEAAEPAVAAVEQPEPEQRMSVTICRNNGNGQVSKISRKIIVLNGEQSVDGQYVLVEVIEQ